MARIASPTHRRPPYPDLSALPIAGIGRRQLALILGAVATVWIVVLFARQIGDASAASTRAEDLAAANATLRDDIEGYRRELALIQRQEYILIQARGYGLGKGREIPFSLAPDAPSLPPDAPGSASVRVGSDVGAGDAVRALDGAAVWAWLTASSPPSAAAARPRSPAR